MTSLNFDSACARVSQLADDFQQHEKTYTHKAFSEADVRLYFIDKFFVALGWDIYNERRVNPLERDVKIEESVEDKSGKKKADYAFFAQNFRDVRFFVEAKRPSREIDNAEDYFQTIRYGWNASAPVSVLTDFEQFRVLDCRYKPDKQTAIYRALRKYHYTDYAERERFREIYDLFSREAVMNNSLEAFAKTLPKAAGRASARKLFATGVIKSVDEDFLAELDELRLELARSFKLRNPSLSGEDLTEATQRTLDRFVFMRFLEDKLIEPQPIVERLGENGSVWQDFAAQSARLNSIYNGIVFKPHAILDKPDFAVDERVFASVRERLAHTNSPYDFNSLPVAILGSIYERFLGKVITTTDKRAQVVEKPEVRKAGGVYYTPEYIVRYIVKETIGKLIADKTPNQIAELRFADIACGSGSFLLGVFDELLRRHTAFYNEGANRKQALATSKKRQAACVENADGSLRLSLDTKKEILLNNIYGVDLDAQAVEVAQVSLYLKLLEDETTVSAKEYQLQFRETMLPPLDENIVHGNSLIGWDILEGSLFETKDERKLFPLDFAQVFPQVMKQGGFDAIVGNPPYGADFNVLSRKYLANKFPIGTTDSAALMMLRAVELTKPLSRIGLIVPKPFTYSSTWSKTRAQLLSRVEKLVDVGKVWKEVKLEQVICIFDSTESNSYESWRRTGEQFFSAVSVSKDDVRHFNFYINGLSNEEILIGRKLVIGKTFLGEITKNTRGGMFQNLVNVEAAINEDLKVIGGKQLQRYAINGIKGYISSQHNLPENAFVKANSILVQNIVAHVLNPIDHIKIIGTVANESEAGSIVILDTVNQLTNVSNQTSIYLLALLHSRLINWFVYRFIFAKAIRTMHFDAPVSDRIPIRTINFADKADSARHERMVKLVERILDAKRKASTARNERDRNHYAMMCVALDNQIDKLVYELYALTEDEIRLVEAV